MKKVLVVVPAIFLLALIFLAVVMYQGTESNIPCTGAECAELTADELVDRAIEAKTQ